MNELATDSVYSLHNGCHGDKFLQGKQRTHYLFVYWVNLHAFLSSDPLIFFKINFFKKLFHVTIRVSNSLYPDQACCFDGPDLGPNCLQ